MRIVLSRLEERREGLDEIAAMMLRMIEYHFSVLSSLFLNSEKDQSLRK